MRLKSLTESFNWAIDGVMYCLKKERNMRVHAVMGCLALLLAALLDVTRLELLVLFLTIGAVLAAEMFNTAIEEVVNLITNQYHPIAERAKNASAGAVLILALAALVVGYLVFFQRIIQLHPDVVRRVYDAEYLVAIALTLILALTIGMKMQVGRGSYMHGGMPSGHTGIAFGLATAIWMISDGLPAALAMLLALLVAQSRVSSRVHTWWETTVGAILGTLVTVLIFQL